MKYLCIFTLAPTFLYLTMLALKTPRLAYVKKGDTGVRQPQLLPAGGIYFLETSGGQRLSERQLCAVESAARAHPSLPVVVCLFSNQPLKKWIDNVLTRYYNNVMVVNVDVAGLIDGTPVASSNVFDRVGYSPYEVMCNTLPCLAF